MLLRLFIDLRKNPYFSYIMEILTATHICVLRIGMDMQGGGNVLTDTLFLHLLEWNVKFH